MTRRLCVAAAVAVLGAAGAARAGPPFVSDDPEPTDLGHWEIYNFVSGAHTPGDTAGEAGPDVNYGAAKDIQLTVDLPIDFESHAKTGLGDVELAVKYRFLHQAAGSPLPDVAIFPRLFVPTAARQFGSGHAGLLLPIWAQKDFGEWSLFGGGGYQINPGRDNRNFWLSGLGLSRSLTDRLSVGGEVYHQTPDTLAAPTLTGFNIGVTYKVTSHWAVLASGGPIVTDPHQGGQYGFYFSIEATY